VGRRVWGSKGTEDKFEVHVLCKGNSPLWATIRGQNCRRDKIKARRASRLFRGSPIPGQARLNRGNFFQEGQGDEDHRVSRASLFGRRNLAGTFTAHRSRVIRTRSCTCRASGQPVRVPQAELVVCMASNQCSHIPDRGEGYMGYSPP